MPWNKLEKPLNFIVEKMRQPCPRYVSRWARIPCGITCWAWDPLSSGRNQFTVCYLTYQSEAVFGISSPFWCELIQTLALGGREWVINPFYQEPWLPRQSLQSCAIEPVSSDKIEQGFSRTYFTILKKDGSEEG